MFTMLRNTLYHLFIICLLILETPIYAVDLSPNVTEKYTLKISRKFSNTYCNSIKFGISKDGAMNFSIGETNKEFLNNKLNKFIDYELLNKNILLNLQNTCQVFDFPKEELKNLKFKY